MSVPSRGMSSIAIQPTGRSSVVDDQQVLRLLLQRVAAGGGRVIADASRGHGPERELADAPQRQPLEPAVGTDEPSHELRRGIGEDLGGRRELGELAPCLHHRDEVAHLDRLVDVVGDEQDRLREVLLEAQELVLEAFADDRVDGPEGLVHEHDRRVHRQGSGHADALALAATQLRRVAVAVLRGIEPDEREQLIGALSLAVLRPADQARDGRDVLADRLMGEEARLLDDVADRPAQVDHVALRDVLAVDEDPPRRRLDQPVDHLEAGRLATARRSDQHADLAGRHLQREVVDGPGDVLRARVIALRDAVELDGRGARRLIGHGRGTVLHQFRVPVASGPEPTLPV